MMGLVLCSILLQDKQLNTERNPETIISNTLARYWNAKSLSGTIVQTVADGGGSKKYTTQVSYVRPTKILVQQDYVGKNGLKANLVSDGVKFAYDPPFDAPVPPKPRERLYEPVVIPKQGTNQQYILSLGEMYNAAHKSLAASTFLDIAIAYKKHLEDFKINVATLSLVGVETLNGAAVYHISGLWQPYSGATPTGRYDLYISLGFDLVKFVLRETYSVQGRAVQLTITETADLKVNAQVNEAIFRVD